jgi:hypothetical protein
MLLAKEARAGEERMFMFEWKDVNDTANYLLQVVDNATLDGQGGKFMNFNGQVNPW